MYSAEAILLRGETPDHCVARKCEARAVAERLSGKATVPSIARYWRDVMAGLDKDIARLEKLRK